MASCLSHRTNATTNLSLLIYAEVHYLSSMRILLISGRLAPIGGADEHIATLACELSRRGHQVTFFSRCHIAPDNQYLARMQACGIECQILSKWIDSYIMRRESWRLKLINLAVTVLTPLLWCIAWIVALQRKRSFQRSLVGCKGALIGLLSRLCPAQEPEVLFDVWTFRRLPKCLSQTQPDVIHVHRVDSLRLIGADFLDRFPIIYTEHGTPTREWNDLSLHLNKATIVVAVSEPSKIAIKRHWKCQRPIVVIPSPVPDPGEPDEMLGYPERSPVTITFIGRIDTNKNVLSLLIALHRLVSYGLDVRLMIAGNGPLMHELQSKTEEMRLIDFVNFYGSFGHDDLPKIMSSTDIVALTSFSEGLPIVLIEAMAYGKPIIASDVGGNRCLVQNGINGFLVDPKDTNTITESLKILVSDAALRRKMSAEARRRYLKLDFAPEKVTDAIERVYQQAIALKRA